MLNHLTTLDPAIFDCEAASALPEDFTPIKKASVVQTIAGQDQTASWLEELGVPDDAVVLEDVERRAAREAFAAVTLAGRPPKEDKKGSQPLTGDEQKQALLSIKTPGGYAHLKAMLTAYDWNFVEQAVEMRSYAVTGILEETKHPDARIRLKALEMLGKVTEVNLFTERLEVRKVDATNEQLEARIRERLDKIQRMTGAVMDVQPKEGPDGIPPPVLRKNNT